MSAMTEAWDGDGVILRERLNTKLLGPGSAREKGEVKIKQKELVLKKVIYCLVFCVSTK